MLIHRPLNYDPTTDAIRDAMFASFDDIDAPTPAERVTVGEGYDNNGDTTLWIRIGSRRFQVQLWEQV